MELSLSEVERIVQVSRYQVSRYAKDCLIKRTRQGHYDAASLAKVYPPFNKWACMGQDIDEERAVWLVRVQHFIHRELLKIINKRHQDEHKGYGRHDISATEKRDIDKTVNDFVAIAAALPNR